MLNSEKFLLVLVCQIHLGVTCFLYFLDIFCLPLFTRCLAKLGHQGKKDGDFFIIYLDNLLSYIRAPIASFCDSGISLLDKGLRPGHLTFVPGNHDYACTYYSPKHFTKH